MMQLEVGTKLVASWQTLPLYFKISDSQVSKKEKLFFGNSVYT